MLDGIDPREAENKAGKFMKRPTSELLQKVMKCQDAMKEIREWCDKNILGCKVDQRYILWMSDGQVMIQWYVEGPYKRKELYGLEYQVDFVSEVLWAIR